MPQAHFSFTNQDPLAPLRPYWVIFASRDLATVGHLRPDELPFLLKYFSSLPPVTSVVTMVTETGVEGGAVSTQLMGLS